MRALGAALLVALALAAAPLACSPPWPECAVDLDCVAWGDCSYQLCHRVYGDDGGVIDDTYWPKCENKRCVHVCWAPIGDEEPGECPR